MAAAGAGFVNVNLGYTRSLTRGVDFFVSLSGSFYPRTPTSFGFSMQLTLGPQFLITGDRPLNGLFVAPTLTIYGGTFASTFSWASGAGVLVGPGLTFGYEFTVGAFHIVPTIGVSGTVLIGASQLRYVPWFDVSFLRIGAAF